MTGVFGFLISATIWGQAGIAQAQIGMSHPMPGNMGMPAGPVGVRLPGPPGGYGGPISQPYGGPGGIGQPLGTNSFTQPVPTSAPLTPTPAPAATAGGPQWSGQATSGWQGGTNDTPQTPAVTAPVQVQQRSVQPETKSVPTQPSTVTSPKKQAVGGGKGGKGDGGDGDSNDGESWVKKIPWWVWVLALLILFAIMDSKKK